MKNLLFQCCLFASLGALLAGCSDKDDQYNEPEFKTPEGLFVTTYYEAFDRQYVYSLDIQWLYGQGNEMYNR